MRQAFGALAAVLLVGCASKPPYAVELPLTRTVPRGDEAKVPVAPQLRPRIPHVVPLTLPSGMVGGVVERPSSGLISLIYVNRKVRFGTDYAPTFLGDALLAGAYGRDQRVIYPVALAGRAPRVITGSSGTTISLTCAPTQLTEAIELLAAVVQRPAFDASWLTPVRSRTNRDLLRLRGLYWEWSLAKYHSGEPFWLDPEDVAERVQQLDQHALRLTHQELFRPEASALVVVGDVSASQAQVALSSAFGDWRPPPASVRAEAVPAPAPAKQANDSGRNILVFDEPSYPHVTVIQNAPPVGSLESVAFELLSGVLVSEHGSGLMSTLRHQHGDAYGVWAKNLTVPNTGRYLFLSTAVAAKTLARDTAEMLRALARLRTAPVDADSLARAKNGYGASLADALSSQAGVAHYLAQVELGDAPPLQALEALLDATTPETLQRVAARYLDPERATVVVKGDASGAVAELGRLGEVSVQ